MELKNLLKEKRLEKGLTLQEVADFAGINVSTLSRYERGEIANMKADTMKALSKLLDIPLSKFIALPDDKISARLDRINKNYQDLIDISLSIDFSNIKDSDFEAISQKFDEIIKDYDDNPKEAQEVKETKNFVLSQLYKEKEKAVKKSATQKPKPEESIPNKKKDPGQADGKATIYRYPLYGDIACGEPIYADGQLQGYVETDTNVKADFCIRAKGDSMIGDRICDGDLVFIKSQSVVENGEIAAVLVDGEATLKRIYYDKELELLRLFPSNPNCKIKTYRGSELDTIHILGKAVKCQFDLNH